MENWYLKFAIIIMYIGTEEILLLEHRIEQDLKRFFDESTIYLFNRFLPMIKNIPNEFFSLNYAHLPSRNIPQVGQLIKELLETYEEYNLHEVIIDPEKLITTKIKKFKENYNPYYSILANKCGDIGKIWVVNENSDPNVNPEKYGNDLYNIFQLRNNNTRTPPELVTKCLTDFIHIRNAISHPGNAGIYPYEKNKVKILDRNTAGAITFEETIHYSQLWKIYYWLITFDKALITAIIMLDVGRDISHLNQQYTMHVKCYNCNKITKKFLPPWKKQTTCPRCKKVLYPNGVVKRE